MNETAACVKGFFSAKSHCTHTIAPIDYLSMERNISNILSKKQARACMQECMGRRGGTTGWFIQTMDFTITIYKSKPS